MRLSSVQSGSIRTGKRVLFAVAATALLVGGARFAKTEPLAETRPARVVVAPASFRIFGPPSEQSFDYSLGPATRRAVTRYLGRHDSIFEVVTAREVRRRLRSEPLFADSLSVARDWAEMGTDSYKHLRTDRAVEQLEKALERYYELGYDQVAPKRVAEVAMYLALSYLNKGDNAARPLEVMKRMIRLDPSRVLRRGFYPDRVANFYRTARQDLLRRLRARGPREERAKQLVDRMDADLAVFGGTFRTENGGYRVKLFVYSRTQGGFVEPFTERVERATKEALTRTANRLAARIATCVYEPTDTGGSETVVEGEREGPFSVELTFTYASFLEYPDAIAKPFGNAGVGIGSRLALTDEFGLGLSLHLLSSFRDYSGRIRDPFSTFRILTGPDLGIGVGPFDFGLSARLELARIGDFRICADSGYPPERPCPQIAQQSFDKPDVVAGFNTRPRIRLQLFQGFEMVAAASFSTYLLPAARPLNNPLSGEFGIRYRF